uniref:MTSS I-BAR domain containing 1 n=1 Tax=Oryzias sinensis TaxID=183150 RepID=A0A8C7Z362_9TELE
MDAGIEKECSALGGLFQLIMNDMKASYPTWEDFLTKGAKLQSQLRTTILAVGSFLDAFQKVADMATGTRGATKEIGSALTRMCMRHRSIESKLKLSFSESLIIPLESKMEEWKKMASQLDKDHAKEHKKAKADIKKKSSDTIKLQKKVKKGKDEARCQLDNALQDVNVRYAVLEETEKRAVSRALIEERARYCTFVSMLKPVLDHEINMLGEVTHLQTILEDLSIMTAEPNKLPPASEQVILDLKGSDFNYVYQTPPEAVASTNQMGPGGPENGLLPPAHNSYAPPGERARAMSASGKVTRCHTHILKTPSPTERTGPDLNRLCPHQSCSARDQLALTLGALNSNAPRSSRDSLHCSSGYSTQTTTPSCSEDTIHSHVDYESISLHGDADSISFHQLSHPINQSDFDKSSTIPRNSDLRVQYRDFVQSKRPASTVSLLAEADVGGVSRNLQPNTATIRRKPTSKAAFRRGTISGGVPIPISTPQIPLKAQEGNGGSNENVFVAPSPGGLGGFGHNKLCTSTQSLSALPSSSPYYQFIPGQMPIPVPVPTVPGEGGNHRQQQQRQHFQRQQQQQRAQAELHSQQQFQQQQRQLQAERSQQQQHLQQQQYLQQQLQQQQYLQQLQYSQQPHLQQQQPQLQQPQLQQPQLQQSQLQQPQLQQPQLQQPQLQQQSLDPPEKLKLFQGAPTPQEEAPTALDHGTNHQPPPCGQDQIPEHAGGGGDMLTLIRRVTLRRTITNDRSAPLLPAPANHN